MANYQNLLNDEREFSAFYREMRRKVLTTNWLTLCYLLKSKEDLLDIFQKSIAFFWWKISNGSPLDNPPAFFWKIMRGYVWNWCKEKHRKYDPLDFDIGDDGKSLASFATADELALGMELLHQRHEDYYWLLFWRYFMDLNIDEIQQLRLEAKGKMPTEHNITAQLSKARKALKEIIEILRGGNETA